MSDETREEIVSELRAYKAANLDWLTNLEKSKVVAAYRNQLASIPPGGSNLEEKTAEITSLRDAIVGNLVLESDEYLEVVNATFPVEAIAKVIFLRDFFALFFNYFMNVVLRDGRGMICRGPPGIGKVQQIVCFSLLVNTAVHC
mmetsp:Transcript_26404/g.37749  ORF Transcript_26404/g.37749 Transcript_26404/m.37749 type:complete len:144 (-) Transcript_26404:1645-2076(-)